MNTSNELFSLISVPDEENAYQIYESKSNNKMCLVKSRNYPDFNLVLHKHKNGFKVEFFNSTYDLISESPIELNELNDGLRLFFNVKYSPDHELICNFFKWNT